MKNKDKIKFMKITTLVVIGLAFIVLPAMALAATPTAITRPATSIVTDSAVLNGDYNSNDTATDVWFEWGTSYAQVFSRAGTKVNEIFGLTGLGPINYQLTGLTPDTNYYFQIVASNIDGTRPGAVRDFKTETPPPLPPPVINPPTAITRPATSIVTDSAVLNGDYNSNDTATDVWFEWGTSYAQVFSRAGTKVNEIFGFTGLGPINYQLTGLTPDTNYYFQIFASNSAGTVPGAVRDFKPFIAPVSNPAPILPSISPASGTQGQTLDVSLTGADFASGISSVNFSGSGITINSTTVSSSVLITVNITISSSAIVGNRDVTVVNSAPGGGTSGVQTFTVNATVVINSGGGGGGGGVILTQNNNSNNNNNSSANTSLKPVAATSLATSITLDSAKLGGVADIKGTSTNTAYFEYGKTILLSGTTPMQNVGSSGAVDFYATLENLSSNTIYYFRAVVTNQYGVDRGVIRIFKTQNSAGTITSDENETENIVQNVDTDTENENAVLEPENENIGEDVISVNEDISKKSLLASVVAGARNLAPRNMAEWLFLASVILGLVLLARHLFFVAV